MKKIAFFLFLGFPLALSAQNLQQEINEQVWKPFIKTFNEFDTDGFMALHARDVIRSPRDSGIILTWREYFDQQKKGDDLGKNKKSKRFIELHFTERISSGENAIDVGIYKTTSFNTNGEPRSFYGRFLVVLRKENGTWKIQVDTDASEGGTIGEKDFMGAKSMN